MTSSVRTRRASGPTGLPCLPGTMGSMDTVTEPVSFISGGETLVGRLVVPAGLQNGRLAAAVIAGGQTCVKEQMAERYARRLATGAALSHALGATVAILHDLAVLEAWRDQGQRGHAGVVGCLHRHMAGADADAEGRQATRVYCGSAGEEAQCATEVLDLSHG